MPTYKLIYFDVKGRAEPSRYLFALAGVQYEDKRLTQDEWKALKPELPNGQLPCLEIDGYRLTQSHAIYHYLADELGFAPKSALDKAKVIEISETGRDMTVAIADLFREKDESKKRELKEKFENETAKKAVEILEKKLEANNNGQSWFVGDKISLADVMVFNMFYDFVPSLLGKKQGEYQPPSDCKYVAGFLERFRDLPQIKKWIESRKETPM